MKHDRATLLQAQVPEAVIDLRDRAPARVPDLPSDRTEPDQRGGRPRFRLDRWVRPERVLGAAVVALVTVFHLIGLFGFPALGDDEGTYAAQAAAVRHAELAHYTYWYDHPPLGWVQLAALDWVPQDLLPGVQPVAASRLVIVLAAAVSAALTYALARRLAAAPVSAALAVLLAFGSPLAVTLQRQVYLDNLAVPWLLASFVLVLDPSRRLWCHVAAGLCFAAAVGSKETTLVLLPVVLWTLVGATYRPTRLFSVAGFLAGVGTLAYYPLMALLRGEIFPGRGHVSLWDAVKFQLAERPGSGALWQSGSASNANLESWIFYDRWVLVLGLAGLPFVLASRRFRPAGLALLVVTVVALKPGGYLPSMYVIGALPFLGLSAAGAVDVVRDGLLRGRLRSLGRAVTPASVATVLVLALAWAPGLTRAVSRDDNDSRTAAEAWLGRNVPRGAVVLTDDVTWLRLVDRGIVPRRRAIWFYKLDTDPEVKALYRGGWRDVTYVVSTDVMRSAVRSDPTLREGQAALSHSHPVATFGDGDAEVEIRRVEALAPMPASTTTTRTSAGGRS